MPSVLLECGFMDSKTDVPVILTETFADRVADAVVETIVKKGGLQVREGKLYRLQVGAFSKRENAERLKAELKSKGYDAIIV